MKVVILAGGLGTRLHEETETIPKSMVRIGEHPILWHIMKIYAHYGHKDFIICLGYKGDIIKQYFLQYDLVNSDLTVEMGEKRRIELHDSQQKEDWRVTLISTGEKTLKGGRIKRVEKYVKDDLFMLTYGDGVSDINLENLIEFHKNHNRICTVTGVRPPSRFGELLIQKDNTVLFSEKPQTSTGLINGGFFIFNSELFDYLTPDESCDFEKGPLEKLAKDKELVVYAHRGQWECMDTYREMQHLNKLWESGRAFWKVWS